MEQQGITTATIPSETSVATDAAGGEDAQTNLEPQGLQDDACFLPVKFNKQDYHLSREEATAYAQKGMKFDTVEPMLDKLKGLAQAHGLGVRELVDALCEGETPVPTEERLAEEFCRLREHVPDVTAFESLPEAVVQTAVEDGIPLLDAYLRYEYRERRRIRDAEEAARKAGEASAGTQRGEVAPTPDPTVQAMLAGIRRQQL